MSSTPASLATPPRWQPALAIALITTVVIGVGGGLGLLSLPGLLLCLIAGGAIALAVLWKAPAALVLALPAVLPLPQVGLLFPFEMLLAVLTGVILLHGLATRARWLHESHPIEIACSLLLLWGLFTAFWSWDAPSWFAGVRRHVVGLLAFAIAFRLPRLVPRRFFETGTLLCGITIATAALLRAATSGFSAEVAIFRRSTTTDLGWGTANFIATLLLLIAPVAVVATVQGRGLQRLLGWLALPLNAALQILVASRAAAVLFFAGLSTQTMLGLRSRTRWLAILLIAATCTAGLLTPFGQGLVARFTSLRDIGSMVIRIWYFREGWRRVLTFFPRGMGLNQGIAYADHLQGTDTHNYWLDITSELGLPGLLLWIAALVLIFRELRRMRRPGSRDAALGLALQTAFWMGQFHTLVEPTFQGVQYQFLYFWLMGGSIGYARDAERAAASSER